ncbi:MAG: hypothetical protein JSV25_11485, partial [Spirochaetota bacterium]
MNKIFPIIALLFFFYGFIHIAPIHAVTLSSKDILIDVDDDTGRINLSTVAQEDDISDRVVEGVDLLFYDKPPSSFTVIYLNGDFITF